MALNLQFANKQQLADAFVVKWHAASPWERAAMATKLLGWIEANDFTDAQVQNAFGLTADQYATKKAEFTNLRTAYLYIVNTGA